jgi:hypothetical protein
MTNLIWIIYLASTVENLKIALSMTLASTPVALFLYYIIADLDYYESEREAFFKAIKRPLIVFYVLAVSFLVLAPSKSTIYMYAGGVAAQTIAANETLSPIIEKTLTLITKKLNESLAETRAETRKETNQ